MIEKLKCFRDSKGSIAFKFKLDGFQYGDQDSDFDAFTAEKVESDLEFKMKACQLCVDIFDYKMGGSL